MPCPRQTHRTPPACVVARVREAASDRGQACHVLLATTHQPTISGRTTAGATLTCALARVHRETVRIRFPNEPSAPSAPSRPPSNGAPSYGRPQPVASAIPVCPHSGPAHAVPMPNPIFASASWQVQLAPMSSIATNNRPRATGRRRLPFYLRLKTERLDGRRAVILVHLTRTSRRGWRRVSIQSVFMRRAIPAHRHLEYPHHTHTTRLNSLKM